MGKLEDLTGMRFGRLVVVKRVENLKKHTAWLCQCDCGHTSIVRSFSLKDANVRTCRYCRSYSKDASLKAKYKVETPEELKICNKLRLIWGNMKYRCNNPHYREYARYGGRGIKLCDEWSENSQVFITWALENGYKPGLTIDRIDNDGNYEPSNCRFIPRIENSVKKSNTIWVSIDGRTQNLSEWSRELNLSRSYVGTIYYKKGKEGLEQLLRSRINAN